MAGGAKQEATQDEKATLTLNASLGTSIYS